MNTDVMLLISNERGGTESILICLNINYVESAVVHSVHYMHITGLRAHESQIMDCSL